MTRWIRNVAVVTSLALSTLAFGQDSERQAQEQARRAEEQAARAQEQAARAQEDLARAKEAAERQAEVLRRHANTVKAITVAMPGGKKEKVAFLGVSTTPVTPALRDQLKLQKDVGL